MSKFNLDPKLYGRLPMELIREHIMPFAYKPQPQSLLCDIRNFYIDWSFVNSCYDLDINSYYNMQKALKSELYEFCDGIIQDIIYNDIDSSLYNDYMNMDETSYKDILLQYITKEKRSDDFALLIKKLLSVCTLSFIGKKKRDRKNCHNFWILFGILTPEQRTAFINKYIVD